MNELCVTTGCGYVLDLENCRLNRLNDVQTFAVSALAPEHLAMVHVAGGERPDSGIHSDTHSRPVHPDTLAELRSLAIDRQVPAVSLERDRNIRGHEAAILRELETIRCSLRRESRC